MKHRRLKLQRPPLPIEAAHRLTLDTTPWLSCDDCFDQIDIYVDDLISGRGVNNPGLRAHLNGCPACCEEARGLIGVVVDDPLDEDHLLRRFDDDLALAAGLDEPASE